MTFHDLQHTLAVARYAVEIGRGCRLSTADVQLLELAALFHDTGYAITYNGHEAASANIAKAWLAKHRGSRTLQKKVETLIMATRPASSPRSLAQRVLRDADSAKAGQLDFEEKSERLRKEFEHVRKRKIKHSAWLKENLAYLEKLERLAPQVTKAFWAFDKAAVADGAIPVKYKELIAVAVALTTQCPYCIDIHSGNARKAGATDTELAEAAMVAASLRAGAAVTHATHFLKSAANA